MRLCYMCLNAHCACVTCVYALCVLCYMCLNVRCACVTCVYTYQTATPQQDTKGTTDGGRIFGSKQQGRFFLHLDTRVLQEWSLCQNNGCCSLLSSSYRSRPSRYATGATSGLITSRQPARRMFFCNRVEQQWSNLGLMKKVSVVLERMQFFFDVSRIKIAQVEWILTWHHMRNWQCK